MTSIADCLTSPLLVLLKQTGVPALHSTGMGVSQFKVSKIMLNLCYGSLQQYFDIFFQKVFELRSCIVFLGVRSVGMVLLSESLTINIPALMVMITFYSNVNRNKQRIMSYKTI